LFVGFIFYIYINDLVLPIVRSET